MYFHQVEGNPAILTPVEGESIQGLVTVNARTAVSGFRSAEISYSYENDTTDTWFLLAQTSAPQMDGTIAFWDTTMMADGDYRLRLQIFLTDGSINQVIVGGLRVRNYLPVETESVEISGTIPSPLTATPTTILIPTRVRIVSTTMPPNPVEVTQDEILSSLTQGAICSGLLFVIIGVYVILRKYSRRR